MTRMRRDVATLIEFLGYGVAQLQDHTALYGRFPEYAGKEREYAHCLYKAGYYDALARVAQAVSDLYGPEYAGKLRSAVVAEEKVFHFAQLSTEEYRTLQWLSERGYDGELLEYRTKDGTTHGLTKADPIHAVTNGDDIQAVGWQLRSLNKAQGLQWYKNVHADRSTFLACNGSSGLAEKLGTVLHAISLKNYR